MKFNKLEEGYLGVLVNKKLQMSQQCTTAATEIKHVLGCICRGTASRDRDGTIPFHSALVRSHLEHCVLFLSPQFRAGKNRLELTQRRAMEMVKELENSPMCKDLRH